MKQPRKRPARPEGDETLFRLMHAAQLVNERLEQGMAEVGLSWAKFSVLEALASAGTPIPFTVLAHRLHCVRSNITQLVDRLETEGLVRRTDDPADRRSVLAELTAEGRQRHAEGRKVVAAAQREVASRATAADRAAIARVVESLR